jgi:hypothetical protein
MSEIIITIVEKWQNWKTGKDKDWIYDESFEFFNNLSRGEMVSLMDSLEDLMNQSKQL